MAKKNGQKLERGNRIWQSIHMTRTQMTILRKLGRSNMAIGLDRVFKMAGLSLERGESTKEGKPGTLFVQGKDGAPVLPDIDMPSAES